MIRILLVDDHPVARQGIRTVLTDRVKDAVVSAAGVGMLITALLLLDGRVRQQAFLLLHPRPSGEFVTFGHELRNLGIAVLQVVRDQGFEQGTLLIFGAAGIALFVFAFRL